MSQGLPRIPAGNGKHPVTMVAIAANELKASTAFYSHLFDWSFGHASKELSGGFGPAGPGIALRAETPEGFPGVVPFIGGPSVEAMMANVVQAGAEVERHPWTVLGLGLARFRDASHTIWGVTDAKPAAGTPPIPAPFGSNPKPPAGTICSLEMYAKDGAEAGKFFAGVFGWGWGEMMPGYTAFDPGAGITGVFQSHTPSLSAMAYIWVDDVRATLKAIEKAGGKQQGDPASMPGMATFGYFKDPSDTPMGLIGPA